MGTRLYWKPHKRERKLVDNQIQLKDILKRRYGGWVNVVLREDSCRYLQGLADAGVPGAAELIDAIDKYDEIVVEEIE